MAMFSTEAGLSFDEAIESFEAYEERFYQFVEDNEKMTERERFFWKLLVQRRLLS